MTMICGYIRVGSLRVSVSIYSNLELFVAECPHPAEWRTTRRCSSGNEFNIKGATFTYEEQVALSQFMRAGRRGGLFGIRYRLLRTSLLQGLRSLLERLSA